MARYKKRADGRYKADIRIGYHEDGRPKTKSIYAHTIKELDEKKAEMKSLLSKGIVLDSQGYTVGTWSDQWLKDYKTNKSYNTWRMYDIVIRCHIKEHEAIPITNLRTHHIQSLINDRHNKGMTRTVEQIGMTYNAILKKAIQLKIIYQNPMDAVEMPEKVKSKKGMLTDLERKALDNADLAPKHLAFVTIARHCGLRRGELLALNRRDIDLAKREIDVNKAIYFKGRKPFFKDPKAVGFRRVHIPDVAIDIISDYISTVEFNLFTNNKGELMTQDSYRAFWEVVKKKVNAAAGGNSNIQVTNITAHQLRHEYATMLYYAEVDIKKAQYLLGHSDINTTLSIYTHLDESNTTDKSKIDAFLSKVNQSSTGQKQVKETKQSHQAT